MKVYNSIIAIITVFFLSSININLSDGYFFIKANSVYAIEKVTVTGSCSIGCGGEEDEDWDVDWDEDDPDEENDGYDEDSEKSEQKKDEVKQCKENANELRQDCISLYGFSGATVTAMCKWLELRTKNPVLGTGCTALTAFNSFQAYRWCNAQADNLVAKCDKQLITRQSLYVIRNHHYL